MLIGEIEDGFPAFGEFFEAFFDEAFRALGPGVESRPKQCAGERRRYFEAQIGRGFNDELELLDRPFAAGFRVASHFGRGEAVE